MNYRSDIRHNPHISSSCLIILILLLFLPISTFGKTASVNYEEQIVITVPANTNLKKALKGLDLKKIKKLKIKDEGLQPSQLDFRESYDVLKKMILLEALDVSECQSLNENIHKASLPISTLIMQFKPYSYGYNIMKFPNDPISAAIYFNHEYPPIEFGVSSNGTSTNFSNLNELILVEPNTTVISLTSEEDELYANLNYGGNFLASYNPKSKLIRYKRSDNLNRSFQFILGGEQSSLSRNRARIYPITPQNRLLEGVIVADASFVEYLPSEISKLVVPSSLWMLLGDYSHKTVSVDTLIVAKSEMPLIMNEGSLYGLSVKNAIFNRPINMIGEAGIGIYNNADKIIFNDDVDLIYPNLGYGINEIIFNGKTMIKSTIAQNVGIITFNDDVSFTYDPSNSSREIIRGAKELFFKKTPKINDNCKFKDVEKVFVSTSVKNDCNHWLVKGAKEINFDSKIIVDSRLQPKDSVKIKPLKFTDTHLFDVEQGGTNRVLYLSTNLGRTLEDGLYYLPVSDYLYLSYSNENALIKGDKVRLSFGYLYGQPRDVLDTHILVFSYIPVKNANGIEYGRTTGCYLVNPKYGEIVLDFTDRATEKSNRTTPYIPPKPQKKIYHEHGRIEDCGICLGTGMGWQGGFCPFCGGKGWYIEHYW